MNKEQLRRYYRCFCHWQQAEPHYVNRHEGCVQHCCNCGTEFADNFCSRCGQRAEMGRVGWKSIKDNIALLWGYLTVLMMLLPLVTIGFLVGYSEDNVNATFGFGDREFSLSEAGPILLSILFLLMALILFVTHLINKRTFHQDT